MIKNILVGYDNSRSAQVALAQAIDLAEACAGRVHLLVVDTEEGLAPEPELPAEPTLVEMAEPVEDAEEFETESRVVPQFVEEARLKLHQAHVAGSIRITSGIRPAIRLREESSLADLVVVGRGGRRGGGGGLAGRTTRRRLQARLRCPTLICASEYIEPKSILLLYEFSPAGGRAVSVAGELSATLNIDLDVVVTANKRYSAERLGKRVASALLAHHAEGEIISSVSNPAEALLTAGLDRDPSIVVIPQPPRPMWSWQLPPLYTAALQLPHTMILIVP